MERIVVKAGADAEKLPARLEKWARMLHEGVEKDDVAARMRDAHCTEADVERVMAVAAMIAGSAAASGTPPPPARASSAPS